MNEPLDIRVGQRWERRDGQTVTIKEETKPGCFYATCEEGLEWHYLQDGQLNTGDADYELTKLIQDVPLIKPDSAKSEIPASIATGAEPVYVLVVSDDTGGCATNGNPGNPITWETQIIEGGNLRAVLRQQALVGSRYGTTYIAECRIIPELTRATE